MLVDETDTKAKIVLLGDNLLRGLPIDVSSLLDGFESNRNRGSLLRLR